MSQTESDVLHLPDAVELPYRIINISGPDAARLLQGQTSVDIDKLPVWGCTYGTANTPKGRIYGLFRIVRTDDGFLLRILTACADEFVQRLGKYAVFYKCAIANTSLASWGLFSSDGLPATPESETTACQTKLGIVLKSPAQDTLYELMTAQSIQPETTHDADEWMALETRSGIPEIYPQTLESFILQHLNLEALGAVSFEKGCYTGQEIIARMKYLGKAKKKMFLLSTSSLVAAEPGSSVLDAQGGKCGELVRVHRSDTTGTVALAVMDEAFAQTHPEVFLATDNTMPLSVQTLNYKKSS